MEQTELKQIVTKDMIIGDVLKQHPDVAVVMLEYGLHCVGCHANVYDTIDAGSKIHGLDDATVDKMVESINKFIDAQAPKEKVDVPQTMSLTDAAAQKVKDLLVKEKQEGFGLRVAVQPGGCSGFVYQLNFEKEPQDGDIVLSDKGVQIFVEKDSIDMIGGGEIDYVENLNESGFKINNPNAKKGCGCGKSFG